jgi:hypothetical protein
MQQVIDGLQMIKQASDSKLTEIIDKNKENE